MVSLHTPHSLISQREAPMRASPCAPNEGMKTQVCALTSAFTFSISPPYSLTVMNITA